MNTTNLLSALACLIICSCATKSIKDIPPPTVGINTQANRTVHEPFKSGSVDPEKAARKVSDAAEEISKISEAAGKAEVTSDDLRKATDEAFVKGVVAGGAEAKALKDLAAKLTTQLAESRKLIDGLKESYRTLKEEFDAFKTRAVQVEAERNNLQLALERANQTIDDDAKLIAEADAGRVRAENSRIADRVQYEANLNAKDTIHAKEIGNKDLQIKIWRRSFFGAVVIIGILVLLKWLRIL